MNPTLRYCLLGSLLLFLLPLSAANYFWVNGSGQWTDYANHWATTSGGTNMHSQPPGPLDQVFFDTLSFASPGDTVLIDTSHAVCRNMDWLTAQFTPTFVSQPGDTLEIRGSCWLSPNMQWRIQGLLRFTQVANTTDSLHVADHLLPGPVQWQGPGTWYINSDLKTTADLWLQRGTLICQGDTLLARRVWLVNPPTSQATLRRDLRLGTTVCTVAGSDSAWVLRGDSDVDGDSAVLRFTYSGPDTLQIWADSARSRLAQVALPAATIDLREGLTAQALTLAAGATVLLPPDSVQPLSAQSLFANGDCGNLIALRSRQPGVAATVHLAAPTTSAFLRLQDVRLVGGATWTANQSLADGNLSGPIQVNDNPSAQTYYWIGNSGDWHDPAHWSLASGGASSGCLPGPRDTVVFDTGSFNQPGSIRLDAVAYCADFDAAILDQPVALTGPADRVVLRGSLTLSSQLTPTFAGEWWLQGDALQTLTLAGQVLPQALRLRGTGGYQQADALRTQQAIWWEQGDWDSQGYPVEAQAIYGDSALTDMGLLAGSPIVLAGADTVWDVPQAGLTLDSAYFFLTHAGAQEVVFVGGHRRYDSLTLQNRFTLLADSNAFGMLTAPGGHSLSLAGGQGQAVDSLRLLGDCTAPVFLRSPFPTEPPARLRKTGHDTLALQHVVIDHVQANLSHGATYLATEAAGFNDVQGWQLSGGGGSTYFWINGSGQWSDTAHWALASGGGVAGCLPGPRDTVIFDGQSFSTPADTVEMDIEAYVARMDWSAVPPGESPVLRQTRNLYAGGDLRLTPALTHLRTQPGVQWLLQPDGNALLFDPAGVPLAANVQIMAGGLTDTIRLDSSLTLTDSLSSLALISGTLLTQGHDLRLGQMVVATDSAKALRLGTSTLRLMAGWAVIGSQLTFSADSSRLILGGSQVAPQFIGGGESYHDLEVRPSGGERLIMDGDNAFHSVLLRPGVRLTNFQPITQTVAQDWTAEGTCRDSINIEGASGSPLTFAVAGQVSGQCLNLKQTTLTGNAIGSSILFSRDLGDNTGWTFDPQPPVTAAFAGPTSLCLEDTALFVSSSTWLSGPPGDLSLFWEYGDGSLDTNLVAVQHQFPRGDTFAVQLIARDPNGCADTVEQPVNVVAPDLAWQVNPSGLSICPGELITFTVQDTFPTDYQFYRDSTILQDGAALSFATDSIQAGEAYYATTTVNGCLARSDTFTFQLLPQPTITLSSSATSDTVCSNEPVVLYASGGLIYDWYLDDSLVQQGQQDSLLLTALSDSQTVRVAGRLSSSGCRGFSPPLRFTVNPAPALTLSSSDPDQIICEGEPVTVTATNAVQYVFLLDGVIQDSNALGSFFTDSLQNGQALSVIGYANGCAAQVSLPSFVVKPRPQASLSSSEPDTTLCQGEAVSFSAGGGSSYQFVRNGQTATNPLGVGTWSPTIPLADGDAIQVVVELNGCFDTSAALTFQVLPLPAVSLTATPTDTICAGDLVQVQAAGADSFRFQVNGLAVAPFGPDSLYLTDSLLDGQTLSVIGRALGCQAQAPQTFTYTVKPLPIVSVFLANAPSSICQGDSVTLVGTGADSYLFLQGNDTLGPGSPFQTADLPVGNPVLTALGTLDGCTALSSNSATVQVKALPPVSATLTQGSDSLCAGDSVLLCANGADAYRWRIDGVAQSLFDSTAQCLATVPANGQVITVEGRSNGCVNSGDTAFAFTVTPLPSFTLSSNDPDLSICAGTPISFQLSGGAISYDIFLDTTFQQSLSGPSAGFTLSNLQDGQTVAAVGQANGCSATQSLTFAVDTVPSVQLLASDPDSSICQGETVIFTATGANTYRYLLAGQTVALGSSYTTDSLLDGEVLVLVGASSQGCTDTSGGWQVEVRPLPTPSLMASDSNLRSCVGDTLRFIASGASQYQFLLDGQPLGPLDTAQVYRTDSLQSGQAVTVRGVVDGCAALADTTLVFQVDVYPQVQLSISPSDLSLCAGDTVRLSATGAPVYQWLRNGQPWGSPDSSGLRVSTSVQDGDLLSVTGINFDCVQAADTALAMQVFAYPQAVSLSSSAAGQEICLHDTVLFQGSGASAYEFVVNGQLRAVSSGSWAFGGLRNGDVVTLRGDNGGCATASPDSLVFTVNRMNLGLMASPDLWLCADEALTLTASGADQYEFFVDGVSQGPASSSSNLTLSNPSDGQVVTFVGVSQATGCVQPALQQAQLRVLARPALSYAGPTEICAGDSTTLYATGAAATSALQWLRNGQPIPGATADSLPVDSGGTYAVATVRGGEAQVWASGGNAYGQLGDSSTFDRGAWAATTGGARIVAIAAGAYHNLAVGQDGIALAWGANDQGQLGIGTFSDRTFAVPLNGLDQVEAVAAGMAHSLFLRQDGTVWSCGANQAGQLGLGNNAVVNFPFLVNLPQSAVALAAGRQHSLALLANGQVYAWGANGSGQLGDGTQQARSLPVLVSGLSNVVAIAAGSAHSLALDAQGRLWAWGNHARGQLGLGQLAGSALPVQVSLTDSVVAIAAGAVHSLYLDADGVAHGCGGNDLGQVGDGTLADRRTFRRLDAPGAATAVFAGAGQSLLRLPDGSVWGWGDNQSGNLLPAGADTLRLPTPLPDVAGALQLAAGQDHSLALLDNYQQCVSPPQWLDVLAAPAVTIDRVGDRLTALPGGSSYQWSLDGVALQGLDTATIEMPQSGTYQVVVTYANGCQRSSTLRSFFLTQRQAAAALPWRVYPTVVQREVWVDLPFGATAPYRLTLYDAAGRVRRHWPELPGGQAQRLTLPALAEGVYLLRVQTANGQGAGVRLLKR